MSKQIVVESKNGASNINKSRQATNISNLEEDKIQWKKIANGDNKNKMIPTLLSRLEKNFEYYGFPTKDDIKFVDIQKLASVYLNADPWLQINYCRDSTRQSVDEDVQAATLAHYVNNSFKSIKNGAEVIFNGKIVSKKEALQLNKEDLDSRSVDIIGTIDRYQVKVFSKYAKVSGSGQSHQANETKNWLKECTKVDNKNILFVAQLDGGEAERHIPALKEQFSQYPNIFVGNTEQIIDWLNSIVK